MKRIKDAFITALIAGILALPLAGMRTVDGLNGLTVEWHLIEVGLAALLIFFGRLLLDLIHDGQGRWIAPVMVAVGLLSLSIPFPLPFLQVVAVAGSFILALRAILVVWGSRFTKPITSVSKRFNNLTHISIFFFVIALILPFTPLSSRYVLDVGIMVMTYVMLAWGLNITVGYAGLLDLGYAGFYALGAYTYALLAQYFGIGFWTALPIAGLLTAMTGLLLGFPVLRLRGDYFAIVTLGFGEIVRLVLINWTDFTGGPNGISGVPRPNLFNLEFARTATEGHRSFHEFFGLEFDPIQRVIFVYYIILALALFVGWLSLRLRRLPLGRAWEAFREDEIACASLGINRWWIKLAAYSLGAMVAGLAGAFFATRQGFISPESFTFTESATMLAIVILGGIGHPLGIVFAALFIIGMPELFRELEQYRMLAFGAGMVLIMIWRPGGMMATRQPTVKLPPLSP
ncbi:MAG: high-affinity branched-chain amino acid ABC transporter permease LivM [Alphaproteobacteria bacterium]